MSDTYIYSGVEKYYSEGKSDNKGKILKILVIALSAFLVIEAIIYSVVMPCLATPKITFVGLSSVSPETILEECGISETTSWMSFDSRSFASLVSTYPLIAEVSVEKKFPDQIVVNVVERKPICFTLANIDGKTVPIQIDKNGVIFSVGETLVPNSMPLITGIELSTVSEGMRVSTFYRTLLEQINAIWEINPAYFNALSEIRIIPTDFGSYELMLYPMQSQVRFLVDRTFDEKTLQYMMVILDVIDSVEPDVVEVDMRYGTVSYKKA